MVKKKTLGDHLREQNAAREAAAKSNTEQILNEARVPYDKFLQSLQGKITNAIGNNRPLNTLKAPNNLREGLYTLIVPFAGEPNTPVRLAWLDFSMWLDNNDLKGEVRRNWDTGGIHEWAEVIISPKD